MRRPRPPTKLPRTLACALGMLCASATSGCFSPGEGIEPPRDRIYFPTGLALVSASGEQGASHLLVANSDYDLQFNAGTLLSLNLGQARTWIPKPCSDSCDEGFVCDNVPTDANGGVPSFWCVASGGEYAGLPCGAIAERPLEDQLLHPGRCEAVDLAEPPSGDEPFLTSSVRIGAFATDVIYRELPGGPSGERAGRVFVPVRGDASLHWADIAPDGSIECEQSANRGACSDQHRAGNDPDENAYDLRLSPEPFAVDASADGEAILVSHQTTGRISLFVNRWDEAPRLEFTLGGLPLRPVGIAAIPPPALAAPAVNDAGAYSPGFLVTFRNIAEPQVQLVRYFSETAGATSERPFLARTGAAGIGLNASGVDSRGIAVDASVRAFAEAECGTEFGISAECLATADCPDISAEIRSEYLACLRAAAATPLDVYVANRAPSSLLVGRTVPSVNSIQSTELPQFQRSEALTPGPSRVLVGQVVTGVFPEQKLEPRVFVACFESRRIFVYDPLRRRFELEITTGRGPHAIAIDSNAGHLYVGHFVDSYIAVISLDQRFARSYGKVLATFGEPTAPRASK